MNKQELIDYCNVLKESKGRFINCIDVDRIIDKIKQLDEPKPVKVPPLVSVWYRINKAKSDSITDNLIRMKEAEAREKHGWVTVNGAGSVITNKE